MCRVDDSEAAAVWITEQRVARKDHRCGECHRTILRGEPYQYHHWVSVDGCGDHKLCSHCSMLFVWISRECGGTIIGQLIEDIEEHATEYHRSDLAQLAAAARDKWESYRGQPMPALPAPLALTAT